MFVANSNRMAILPFHIFHGNFPGGSGALLQHFLSTARSDNCGHARGEGAATAIGHIVVRQGSRISDMGSHLVIANA